MGRYLLGKSSRNFVDTRFQLGEYQSPCWGRKSFLRIINNHDRLLKVLILKKMIILLMRTTLESQSYWGLHWTSLRGCWIRLRFMHDLFCTWYARIKLMHEYTSLWILWISRSDSPKPWFWTVLTPWRWLAKPWPLFYHLTGFMLILISRRNSHFWLFQIIVFVETLKHFVNLSCPSLLGFRKNFPWKGIWQLFTKL